MPSTYAFTIVGGYVGVKKDSEGQSSYQGRVFRFKVFDGGFRVSSHLELSQKIDYSILTADAVTLDGVAVTGTDQQRADALKAAFPQGSTGSAIVTTPMTTAQRNAIVSPSAGTQVYDSGYQNLFFYNGTSWNIIQDTNIKTVTAAYALLKTDGVIRFTGVGVFSVTVFAAGTYPGKEWKFINEAIGTVTLTSSSTIGPSTTFGILANKAVSIIDNGTSYSISSSN